MAAFRHFLVALDGSKLAEAIIPVAVPLAKGFSARVTLFHVLERGAPDTIHGERHLREPAEAEAYLRSMAERFAEAGIACEAHLHRNPSADVAGEILDHAEELSADLIVLTTHGRGGLRELLFGSIAQQVLRRGTLPVVVAGPRAEPDAEWQLRRLLVPLDAKPESEPALSTLCAPGIRPCRGQWLSGRRSCAPGRGSNSIHTPIPRAPAPCSDPMASSSSAKTSIDPLTGTAPRSVRHAL